MTPSPDAWLAQFEAEDAAAIAPPTLRTDHLSEVLASYGAGQTTTAELRDATTDAVSRIERDHEIHRAILAAWHRRGDTTNYDSLWEAACWCQSAAMRTASQGRADDFARARAIVAADPIAARAVQGIMMRGRPVLTGERGGNRSLTRHDVRPLRRKS